MTSSTRRRLNKEAGVASIEARIRALTVEPRQPLARAFTRAFTRTPSRFGRE